MSVQSKVTNMFLKSMSNNILDQLEKYDEQVKMSNRKLVLLPKGVEAKDIKVNCMMSEILTKKGNDKGLVFYIHGGGFTTGSAIERRMITQYIVDRYGYDCISINYRLSPEYRWPTHLDDCFEAYQNVLKDYDHKDIVLMGESAGGQLVLSLCLLCKMKDIPLPKAIVSFSPCTDHFDDLPSHRNNIETDYMLKDLIVKGLIEPMFGRELSDEELKDPLLSPYFGDYSGLPPIFLSVSDCETLYDDTMILYEKLVKNNHIVEIDIKKDMCHAFPIMTFIPEAKDTLDKCFDFIKKHA